MLKHLILMSVLLIASPAFAAIYDFSEVEVLEKTKSTSDEKKEIATAKKIEEEALKAQQAKAKRQQLIAAAKARREADEKAIADRAYEDRKADKTREQDYEDKLRVINLLSLQTKADRANDFIDADLSRQTASTDGVQADADRTRMGGEAEIKLAENPKVIVVTGLLAGLGMIFVMIVVWLARKKRTNPL